MRYLSARLTTLAPAFARCALLIASAARCEFLFSFFSVGEIIKSRSSAQISPPRRSAARAHTRALLSIHFGTLCHGGIRFSASNNIIYTLANIEVERASIACCSTRRRSHRLPHRPPSFRRTRLSFAAVDLFPRPRLARRRSNTMTQRMMIIWAAAIIR